MILSFIKLLLNTSYRVSRLITDVANRDTKK